MSGLGATQVIDYTRDQWHQVLEGQNFDVVLACIRDAEASAAACAVLKPGGHFISINGEAGGLCRLLQRVGSSLCGCGPKFHMFTCFGDGGRQQTLADLANKRGLKPVIDRVFEFSTDGVREAFAYQIAGKARGKCVVAIPGNGSASTFSLSSRQKDEL